MPSVAGFPRGEFSSFADDQVAITLTLKPHVLKLNEGRKEQTPRFLHGSKAVADHGVDHLRQAQRFKLSPEWSAPLDEERFLRLLC